MMPAIHPAQNQPTTPSKNGACAWSEKQRAGKSRQANQPKAVRDLLKIGTTLCPRRNASPKIETRAISPNMMFSGRDDRAAIVNLPRTGLLWRPHSAKTRQGKTKEIWEEFPLYGRQPRTICNPDGKGGRLAPPVIPGFRAPRRVCCRC